jgi:hypothetical protein
LPAPIFGYGNEGHQTVAAIADKLIANSPNTVAHVRALRGNETREPAQVRTENARAGYRLAAILKKIWPYPPIPPFSVIATSFPSEVNGNI